MSNELLPDMLRVSIVPRMAVRSRASPNLALIFLQQFEQFFSMVRVPIFSCHILLGYAYLIVGKVIGIVNRVVGKREHAYVLHMAAAHRRA
ncbi:hypothetical protein ABZU53_11160 [Micromonospora sp. NPDC005194]|uniref:hypothetical protein n=1 Tax=Micromonospora sp. NPDC005194 TaxID=3156870 RepID=UPI0033B6B9CF